MSLVFPFILIIISLSVVIYLVIKKFPQLSLLDVDSIPEVQMKKKKNSLIKKKLAAKAVTKQENTHKQVSKARKSFSKFQTKFRTLVTDVYKKSEAIHPKKKEKPKSAIIQPKAIKKVEKESSTPKPTVPLLLEDAKRALDQRKYDLAEQKYIEIIRLDQKNKEAYLGLMDVYMHQDQHEEAHQTGKYVLSLHSTDEHVYQKLCQVAIASNDTKHAVKYCKKALELSESVPNRTRYASVLEKAQKHEEALTVYEPLLSVEPENPKHLDKITELAIIVGNKKKAETTLEQLRRSNPDNAKLEEFQARIEELS